MDLNRLAKRIVETATREREGGAPVPDQDRNENEAAEAAPSQKGRYRKRIGHEGHRTG